MEIARRLFVAAAILAISAGLYLMSQGKGGGYGLRNLLEEQTPPPDGSGSTKLDFSDVQVIRQMSEESAKLSDKVLPCVVSINTLSLERTQTLAIDPLRGFVPQDMAKIVPGTGSGVIISAEGLVVTNYHVINGVKKLNVVTHDKRAYAAEFLGADRERDVALLRIESSRRDFPWLAFANSDDVKVGQIVFAVGNPFGLTGSVTQGIVSARDRHIRDGQQDFIQTDAVINPGSSGGALVDFFGRVVGVTTSIYRGDENVRAWQGVGLAIPANDVKRVVEAVQGRLRSQAQAAAAAGLAVLGRGYLGIELQTEPVEIDPLVLGTPQIGAVVTDVDPRSPAATAGIKPGDVITKFQGMAFRSPADLLQVIRTQPVGSQVTLQVVRKDETLDVPAKLGERPDLPDPGLGFPESPPKVQQTLPTQKEQR
jgi:S1-C subfamily serine protease